MKKYKATLKERQAEYKDGRRKPQIVTEEQKAYYERLLPGKYNFTELVQLQRPKSDKAPIKGAEKVEKEQKATKTEKKTTPKQTKKAE